MNRLWIVAVGFILISVFGFVKVSDAATWVLCTDPKPSPAEGKICCELDEGYKWVSLVHAGLNSITPTIIVKFRDLMDMKAKLREALIKFKQTSTLL